MKKPKLRSIDEALTRISERQIHYDKARKLYFRSKEVGDRESMDMWSSVMDNMSARIAELKWMLNIEVKP